jgi:uncharacterized protein YjbI with pentapeptide repeats
MKLKTITREELSKVLVDHKLWKDTEGKEGKRADLNYSNLSFVDLSNSNLTGVIDYEENRLKGEQC